MGRPQPQDETVIPSGRFLAARHIDENAWFAARATGVTATAVAEVAAKRDRVSAITEWLTAARIEQNDYMRFGTESEAELMRYAHDEHGILPVDWVIEGDRPGDLATPDGLSLDHRHIGEGKTTGKPWDGAETNPRVVPIRYRRQVQWQLNVTGADACLFLWQLRVPDGQWFRFGWFEPRSIWIERDEDMIRDLRLVADDMKEARHGYREAA
ncbi:YqaJ viral recombinase family protein [Microbacterium sp. A1-JK]|uniref:YqaJ viral recombinase family protein n=1 Tax=Microbacterium sp. A1-JK TaxID=3177516 RepID=UPI00388934D7